MNLRVSWAAERQSASYKGLCSTKVITSLHNLSEKFKLSVSLIKYEAKKM
jgi:hypothetical protein